MDQIILPELSSNFSNLFLGMSVEPEFNKLILNKILIHKTGRSGDALFEAEVGRRCLDFFIPHGLLPSLLPETALPLLSSRI